MQTSQLEKDASDSEEEEVGALINLGNRTAMETFQDMMRSASQYFEINKQSKKLGYTVSYPEFRSMQFLQIQFTLLADELNKKNEEIKILRQYRLDHEKRQRDWYLKVEASAGDVQDTLKELAKENVAFKENIKQLDTELKNTKKELEVYKSVVDSSSINMTFEELQKMISDT